ncbi:MAG: winged helix-turn-helix transcriptional regulator [Thermoproteota archaeon]|nr:winged helix-turn-helix transcriptional regulator [Thermoproteota archaeon]
MRDVNQSDTKVLLLEHIEKTPGIRYRELLRLTGLINGVLTYHLAALEKANVIKAQRESRITRYYPAGISDKESVILKFIRHEPIREILLFILEHEMCTFNEIVEHSGKAASTVSSHLKRLKEDQIVSVKYGEYYQLYVIIDKELVYETMSKYRAGTVDKVVENYTAIMEEL